MTDGPNIAPIRAAHVPAQIIKLLRDALVKAEAGEMTGIMLLFTDRAHPGRVTTWKQCEESLELLGAIHVVAGEMARWIGEK